MKRILLAITLLGLMTYVSSCAKCVTCRNADEKFKICDKDWDGGDQGDEIRDWENLGWDCKKSTDSY